MKCCCAMITIMTAFYFNGQKTGTRRIVMMTRIIVSGNPALIKSMKRYLPGPYTKTLAGSKGVASEMEALIIMAMAKVRGFTCIISAAFMATGRMTKAAAAFDMGCVRKITSTQKAERTAITAMSQNISVILSARKAAVPDFSMANPKALMPPISMMSRQRSEE